MHTVSQANNMYLFPGGPTGGSTASAQHGTAADTHHNAAACAVQGLRRVCQTPLSFMVCCIPPLTYQPGVPDMCA